MLVPLYPMIINFLKLVPILKYLLVMGPFERGSPMIFFPKELITQHQF